MADRENPAMNAVQTPTFQAGVPALSVHSGGLELSQRDHAMLAGGYAGNEGVSVAIADFCMHLHA